MMYWIHPDYPDAASIFHSHLNRLIQMTNKKNGTPVYVELDVIDMGKTDEGFAADYEGVYSVTKIKKITNY